MLDVNGMTGSKASDEVAHTACFTYSPDIAPHATRLAKTGRDFSDTPEEMLKFV